MLGKITTLMIRYNIWHTGLVHIKEKLFLGYGYITGTEMYAWFGIPQIHLHNQFLMLLLEMGIVGTGLFALFLGYILKIYKKYKNLPSTKVLTVCLFVLFLCIVVEIFITQAAYLIWPICFYLSSQTKRVHEQFNKKAKLKRRILYKFI